MASKQMHQKSPGRPWISKSGFSILVRQPLLHSSQTNLSGGPTPDAGIPPDSINNEPDQVIVASLPATSHQDHRASTCLTTASQKTMAILA
ncbi:MAG: hypothetical protein IIA53_10345 [Chloroflexi bacterium]|nr:hypothetical protein [Chloroflexota bacterium]